MLDAADNRFFTFMSTLEQDFPTTVIESAILSTIEHIFTPNQLRFIRSSWARAEDNIPLDKIIGDAVAVEDNDDPRNYERKKFWSLLSIGIPIQDLSNRPLHPHNIKMRPRLMDPVSPDDHTLSKLFTRRLPSILAQLFYPTKEHTLQHLSYRYTCDFTAHEGFIHSKRKKNRVGFLFPENNSPDDWWLCEGSSLLGYILSHFFLLVLYNHELYKNSHSRDPSHQNADQKQVKLFSWDRDVRVTFFEKVESENYGLLFSPLAFPKDGMGLLKSFLVGCTASVLDAMVSSVAFCQVAKRTQREASDAIYPCFFHYGAIGVTDLSARWIRMMFLDNR